MAFPIVPANQVENRSVESKTGLGMTGCKAEQSQATVSNRQQSDPNDRKELVKFLADLQQSKDPGHDYSIREARIAATSGS